jgi:hypothetical protein
MWIDTHCHTKYSYDNWLEPLDLIRRAKALGLDGSVITEHYSYEASLPVEQVGRDEGFLILRGVEIATDKGHLLAYGVEDDGWNIWGRDSYLPLEEVIERINDLGGICAPAHPFRNVGLASLMEGLLELEGHCRRGVAQRRQCGKRQRPGDQHGQPSGPADAGRQRLPQDGRRRALRDGVFAAGA